MRKGNGYHNRTTGNVSVLVLNGLFHRPLRALTGYNYRMNPLQNPLSRRAWKRWAYSLGNTRRNNQVSGQKIHQSLEKDINVTDWSFSNLTTKDKIMIAGGLIFLAVSLLVVCLAVVGFWYLITRY